MTVEHERWGPNGVAVEQIVRRVSQLTDDELRRLASAWNAWTAPEPAEGPLDFGDSEPWQVASDEWNDAEDALDAAVAAAGRTKQVQDAGYAAFKSTPSMVGGSVLPDFAAYLAASVAAAGDLVGTAGYTIAHADMLLGPWRAVVDAEDVEPVCECRR